MNAGVRVVRGLGPSCAAELERLPPIVLLHGWGNDSRALHALALQLGEHTRVSNIDLPGFGTKRGTAFPTDPRALVSTLLRCVPSGAVIIGWSLGGAIGTLLAHAAPQRIVGLVTIATNPCFVQRDDWTHGMDRSRFAAFRTGVQADPAHELRRFTALQTRGEVAQRTIARVLRVSAEDCADAPELLAALDMLGMLDNRERNAALVIPSLHVLGELDALVSCEVAEHYRCMQPRASVWLLAQAAHAPFLSRPEAVVARIVDFLHTRFGAPAARPRDTQAVARSFAHAAPRYDDAAGLQRQIGNTLLARTPARAAQRVLDLGCGTGAFCAALGERFATAEIVALDIAEGMLRSARLKNRWTRTHWVGAQAEHLPLANSTVDVVYSNLVLQWCEDLPAIFAEMARVMSHGGEAHIATLGPDTLWELRASWRAVDRYEHVNRFATLEVLAAAALHAGLELRDLHQEYRVLRYVDVQALGRELRQLGAHNLNRGRRSGLAGRKSWQRLQQAYQELGDADGGLPATYQVVYLQLRKTDG